MKKYLLILLLLSPLLSLSQIRVSDPSSTELVGEAKITGFLFMSCHRQDDIYVFRYKDMKYTRISEWKSFGFIDKDNAFEEFYNIIVSVLDTGEKVTIDIPEGKVTISNKRVLGTNRVEFIHTSSAGVSGITNNFNRRQIDALFGKS